MKSQSVLNRLGQQIERDKYIVKMFKQFNLGQTLVFCCSVDHAIAIAKLFNKNKINAKAVTGSSASPDNRKAIEDFINGDVEVLTTVILLTEGVDLPNCETVVLARPTQSEILLKQMIGRAMRGEKVGGTKECLIIDFFDVFKNFPDVSGTSLAFAREYDENISKILKKRPSKNDKEGANLSILLRLRDWLTKNYHYYSPESTAEIITEEIEYIIEFYDKRAQVNRSLLVSHSEKDDFAKALYHAREKYIKNPREFDDPISGAVAIRKVYDKHFDEDSNITEEDFVSVIAEGIQHSDIETITPAQFFERAPGITKILSAIGNSPTPKAIGIDKMINVISNNNISENVEEKYPQNKKVSYTSLKKAWIGFKIAKGKLDYQNMQKYADIINDIEEQLGKEITDFRF